MSQTKSIIDASAVGTIKTKTELMEKLASNYNQMAYDRPVKKSTLVVLQMDAFNVIFAQIEAISE